MTRLGITRLAEMIAELNAGILLLAVLLPVFWQAVWKRKNWARWVLFLAFIISPPLPFLEGSKLLRPDYIPMTVILFSGIVVEIAAFYFAFTGGARPWFQQEISN